MLKSVEGKDGEGPDWEEESAKEDQMLLHEFERRMSFNKKQVRVAEIDNDWSIVHTSLSE